MAKRFEQGQAVLACVQGRWMRAIVNVIAADGQVAVAMGDGTGSVVWVGAGHVRPLSDPPSGLSARWCCWVGCKHAATWTAQWGDENGGAAPGWEDTDACDEHLLRLLPRDVISEVTPLDQSAVVALGLLAREVSDEDG